MGDNLMKVVSSKTGDGKEQFVRIDHHLEDFLREGSTGERHHIQ